MRVHKISIENITSLRGEHHIDFDQLLGTEDIFAITGPTGSGKSSILSAIGLALYNTANKEGVGPLELIAQGADYGRIVLDFSITGKEYRSVWDCRLKQKNGVFLKNPKQSHQFYCQGQIIEQNGEEILGLSYDQFSKTVILNQGQFAEFITGKYTERRTILEKLFDSEQLTKIGILLNEKLRIQRSHFTTIDQSIETIGPLSQVGADQLEKEASESKSKLEGIKSLEKIIQKFYQSSKDYLKLRLDLLEQTQKKSRIESEIAIAINSGNQLQIKKTEGANSVKKKQDELNHLRPQLLTAIEKNKELLSLAQKRDELRQHYAKLENQIKARSNELAQHIKEKSHYEELLKIHINDFPQLYSYETAEILRPKCYQLKRLFDIKNTISEGNRLLNRDQERQRTGLNQKEAQLSELKSQYLSLEMGEYDESKVSFTVSKLKETIEQLELEIKELYKQEQQTLTLKEKLTNKNKDIDKLNNNISNKEKSISSINLELTILQQKIEIIEKEHKLKELDQAIELCSKHSSQTGKCVVCQTPWRELPLFSQIHRKEDGEGPDLKKLYAKYTQDQAEVTHLKRELDVDLKQLSELKNEMDEWTSIIQSSDVGARKLAMEQTNIKLQKAIGIRAQAPAMIGQIEATKKDIDKLKNELAELHEQQNKGKKEEENITRDISLLVEEIRTRVEYYPTEAVTLLELFEKDRISIDRRRELATLIENSNQFQQQLEKEFSRVQSEMNELQANGKKIANELDSLKKEIEEKYSYQNPANLLEKLTQELHKAQGEFNTINEKWLTTNKEIETKQSFINGIDDIIKAKILEKMQLEGLNLNCPTVIHSSLGINCDIINTFNVKKNELFLQTDEEAKKSLEILIQGGIIPLLDEANDKKEEHSKSFHHLNGQRMIVLQNQERLQKLHQERLIIKEELDRLTLLNEVIGKQEFRDFALSIIERELIRSANIELKRICDARYQLKQQQSGKHKYEFFVIDHFAGAQERKVNTLSGGETFLVSLAMAMALSEMTRGKTEIDSFFIDEGFGSLDDESLNDALDTLLQIRNRGKRIGIISHVQGLTERIPVNIRLTKSELGESTLSFIQQSL